jgi:epoxide hydrolase
VTSAFGHMRPKGLAGIHFNWAFVFPEKIPAMLSPEEKRDQAAVGHFAAMEQSNIFALELRQALESLRT